MTEWLHGEISQIQGLVQAAVLLIGLAVVAATFAKTKAVVPTLGALVFAFIVVWAVHNVDWFDQKIDQEFNSLAPLAPLDEPLAGELLGAASALQ